MPVISANTTDGYQSSNLIGTWNDAHDATTNVQAVNSTATNEPFFGPRVEYNATRGIYFIVRTFFDFDVSGISGNVTAATFSVMTDNQAGNDVIVVKSGHDKSDTSTNWYSTWLTGLGGTISGWSNSDSQVVPYTNNVTMAGSAGTTTFPFNSQGVTDVNSLAGTSTAFKIVLMNYDFDYLDVDPQPSGGSQITGLNFADHGTVAKRPFLEITVGTAGYGHKVINVPASDISKVIGVATADIDKVIGVD